MPGSAPSSRASARSRFPAGTRRSRCCSSAPPTSPSTSRTASSTAASPGSTSCASAAREVAELLRARLRLVHGSRPRCRRSRRCRRSPSSTARRVATVYPAADPRSSCRSPVELVDVTGSVELAPRLGLADAIVDLVSSGNTLRTNGLRSLGVLLESRGRARRPRERERAAAVRGDAARGRRRAPPPLPDAQRARVALWPRSARSSPARARRACCRSPRPGMVAIHALVPADERLAAPAAARGGRRRRRS